MRRVACLFVSMLLMVVLLAIPGTNADERLIILDDPDPTVYEASEYEVEGSLPIGCSASVNGEESEVFRKFKHTVDLNADPSFTAVSIELFDENGSVVESGDLQIENNHILKMWLQQDNPNWMVEGDELKLNNPPQNVGGSMMIPFRAIAEDGFGAEISWIPETRTVIMELDNTILKLTIEKETAYVNDKEVILDAPATIINGMTMVPLRFIGEAFGAEVMWHAEDRSITIKKIIHPDPVGHFSFDFIILDQPNPSLIEEDAYKVEGEIPIGHTVKVDGVDAEIFRKFRHTITLKEAPSFTDVDIEITDTEGVTSNLDTYYIENVFIQRLWCQRDNLVFTINGNEYLFQEPPQIINGSFMLPLRAIAEDAYYATGLQRVVQ